MSMLVRCNCNVNNLNADMLQEAMKKLAKKYNGSMTTRVSAHQGSSAVDAGFTCDKFPEGVGMRIQNGQAEIVMNQNYQRSGIKKELEDTLQQVKIRQIKTGLAKSLKRMGFSDVEIQRVAAKKLALKVRS